MSHSNHLTHSPRTESLSNRRLLKLNHLHQTLLVRREDTSNVGSTPIPLQNRITHQISEHWGPFKDLRQTFTVSCRVEQSSPSHTVAYRHH